MTSRPVDECMRVIAAAVGITTRSDDQTLVLAFVAHVEAELAKRGWRAYGHAYRKMALWRPRDNKWAQRTASHPYDPTDPISTVHAKLRAMAEAVEMMKGGEG